MNRLTVSLPDNVHARLKDLAKREGVSMNQYVAYAIAHQVETPEGSSPLGDLDDLLDDSDEADVSYLWPTKATGRRV